MKYLLGTKEYMTQIFDENAEVVPVTVIKTGPMSVLSVKGKEKDGYMAVVFGYGEAREKRVAQAQKGQYKTGSYKHVKELRTLEEGLSEGDIFDASVFEAGDNISVTGVSKGKGFQGVVKRHNFAGGPKSHGQKHSLRAPGSIGAGGPQRVLKGLKMAGRMGSDTVTVKNLSVARVDTSNGLIFVRGAVPGRKGTLIEIRGENV